MGPAGHVTGLDLSPDNLTYATDLVKKMGFSDRISFRKGDVRSSRSMMISSIGHGVQIA